MDKYPDFWSVLIGNGPAGFFFGYVALSMIAAFGMILIMATQKYKTSEKSPDVWSWKYFWVNNMGKFLAGFFLLPLFIRLIYERVDAGWMVPLSIGVGFGFLALAKIATNFGILTTEKLSQQIAEKIKQDQSKKP